MADEGIDFTNANWKFKEVGEALTSKTAAFWAVEGIAEKAADVAQIGDTIYQTLGDALKAATAGATIKILLPEVLCNETYTIDKNVTLDVNGCTVKKESERLKDLFRVSDGCTLTLVGTGAVDGKISVDAGAALDVAGDVQVGVNASVAIASSGEVKITGAVNQKLWVAVSGGSFTVTETGAVNDVLELKTAPGISQAAAVTVNGSVKELVFAQESNGKNTAEINGTVETLTLKQSGADSKTTLNGVVGTLNLQHFASAGKLPVTEAGAGFQVERLVVRPALAAPNPTVNDMANPEKAVEDIIIIAPMEGHKITEAQVDISNASWENPNNTGTGDKNTLVWTDGKDYKNLTKAALDDDGNLVLRKGTMAAGYIFLDGVGGNDDYDGTSNAQAVRTFGRAKKLLEASEDLTAIAVIGQVTVSGKETWSLADGKKLERHATYQGPLVRVTGQLTLENITVDGNKFSASAPMVIVEPRGTLDIKAGAVLTGGKNPAKDVSGNWHGSKVVGGAVFNAGAVNMTGGTISENSAYMGGGIYNRGTLALSGGSIENNEAVGTFRLSGKGEVPSAGGGVFISAGGEMEMSGGRIDGNSAALGGGIGMAGEYVYANETYTLTMTGGTISHNTAKQNGGGIYLNHCCTATITAGDITGNRSSFEGSLGDTIYGGGGIYVNGGKTTDKSLPYGKLNLSKVEISGNTAAGAGGGVAGCNTANVSITLEDGSVIYNNNDGKSDVYITNAQHQGSVSAGRTVFIARYMLGGGAYNWRNVSDNKLTSGAQLRSGEINIYSSAAEADVQKGTEQALVRITGNASGTNGGGIGANGDLNVGKDSPDVPKTSITVEKKWTAVDGVDMDAYYTNVGQIIFQLWSKHTAEIAEDEEPGEDNGWVLERTGKSRAIDGWKPVTFANLPTEDPEGELTYRVTETPDERYTASGEVTENPDGTTTVTFTNTPAYSLKLEKKVEDMYQAADAKQEFAFTITLTQNGEPVHDTFSAVERKQGIEKSTEIAFDEKGQAEVLLGNGDSIHIKGLSHDMKYAVVETPTEGYEKPSFKVHYVDHTDKDNVTPETHWNWEAIIEGSEQALRPGENRVEAVNTTLEPHGGLTITKTVAGSGGDRVREWSFRLKLTDESGAALTVPVGGKPYRFTYTRKDASGAAVDSGTVTLEGTDAVFAPEGQEPSGSFQLRHGESLEIGALPLGVRYEVTESGAAGYDTTVNGQPGLTASGTISKETAATVRYVNTRQNLELTVTKIWAGDAEADRPESVTVQLLRNGQAEGDPVTLDAGNGWTHTWQDLDRDAVWTVAEIDVPEGYDSSVSTDGSGNVIITNTRTPDDPDNPPPPPPPDEPDDPDNPPPPPPREDIPEPPVPVTELPDPNDPESPDVVTILEDDVPTTYVKVQDPETEEFIYIPEEDVPKFGFEVPETGDRRRTGLWALLSLISMAGAAALSLWRRGEKNGEEEK